MKPRLSGRARRCIPEDDESLRRLRNRSRSDWHFWAPCGLCKLFGLCPGDGDPPPPPGTPPPPPDEPEPIPKDPGGPDGSPPGGEPEPPGDPGDDDYPRDIKKSRSSFISLRTGGMGEIHEVVSYRSLGRERAPQFIYNSLSADPRPVMALHPTLSLNAGVPNLVSTRLEVGGVIQGEVFTDTSSFTLNTAEPFRQAIQFNASPFPTGSYPIRLLVTSHFNQGSVGTFLSDTVLVRNEKSSPFGAGWTLDGLNRLLLQTDGSAVLAKGNGGTMLYRRPSPGNFGTSMSLSTNENWSLPVVVADFNEDSIPDLAVLSTVF